MSDDAATRALEEALADRHRLHETGRERHRELLARAIELATRALDGGESAQARVTLSRAHAARAEDAAHGAGQLSRSAQRAPTREDCDDGWERVESIARGAEESASAAKEMAATLAEKGAPPAALRAATKAAERADAAARAARKIVDERNDAYTFHTDEGFSFGEGWYVAAAGVLGGVAIQIEPDKPATAQAERFLRDAGLEALLQPYRPRPRAVKHAPAIIADAFRSDPAEAQRRLRSAFLGDAPIPARVIDWIDRALARAERGPKVLLWVRDAVHHRHRNTTRAELDLLAQRAEIAGLRPIAIGDALRDGGLPDGVLDLTLFWKDPVFQGEDRRRAQLQLFEHLKAAHGLAGQIGVTSAGMDGPALMGLPTLYVTEATNVRMRAWVGVVPGYQEVVRDADYLSRVGETFAAWAAAREGATRLRRS